MALTNILITPQVIMEIRFIADSNVGKLAKLLRMVGYDTLFFTQGDDNEMIRIAFKEKRVILTRDTQIMTRRLVRDGELKALFITQDNPRAQLREIMDALKLPLSRPFSLCLECNQPLTPQRKEEVKKLVPVRVFNTQNRYTECPSCHRIYWEGTHWQAMMREVQDLKERNVISY
ncbi:MAG: Mut7-C RNAse domain-containing protein [Chloroflexota bacterium]|nr:Mut7-C RNAse domain-containing protein [Chloroflexota bacterium]